VLKAVTDDLYLKIEDDAVTATYYSADVNEKLVAPEPKRVSKPKMDFKEYNDLLAPIVEELDSGKESSPLDKHYEALGQFIYNELFPGDLDDFFKNLTKALKPESKLRLRLYVASSRLTNVAWEFAYSKSMDRYVSTSDKTPFTRYPYDSEFLTNSIASRRNKVSEKKVLITRLLCVPANAIGDPYINAEEEIERIYAETSKLQQARIKIEATPIKKPTWIGVDRELKNGYRKFDGYNILHFYGHGKYDQEQVYLTFVGEGKKPDDIDAKRFAALLETPNSSNLKLVFLNACEAAKGSEIDPKYGLVQGLFLDNLIEVSSVLAMQFRVTLETAAEIASYFYYEISMGSPVDEAIQTTRKNLFNASPKSKATFATPVLFMKEKDGFIFGYPQYTNVTDPMAGRRYHSSIDKTSETSDPLSTIGDTKADLKKKIVEKLNLFMRRARELERLFVIHIGKSTLEESAKLSLRDFEEHYLTLIKLIENTFKVNRSEIREIQDLRTEIRKLKQISSKSSDKKNSDIGTLLHNEMYKIFCKLDQLWCYILDLVLTRSAGGIVA
jgi:hypothetical protein